MSDNGGLFSKIGRLFRRRFSSGDDLPLLRGETETSTAIAPRPLFSWGRREDDLSTLQNGLASMSALMNSLRQYLDEQNARHEELLTYLSQLSNALQSIPDTGRVQSETLRVLHQQIAYQNAQHKQLSETLRKISDSSGTQHEVVETLRDRVESLYRNDQQIADTVQSMGSSVQVVSQQSQANTMVLERLRDNLVNRDGDLEKAIRRENRWTRSTLMIVAATSLGALVISVGMAIYSWSAIASVAESIPRQDSSYPTAKPADTTGQIPDPAMDPAPAAIPATATTTAPATSQPVDSLPAQ